MKQTIINNHIRDRIGQNEICVHCKQINGLTSNPLTPYVISVKETLASERIMFIGKTARGDGFGKPVNDVLEDVTDWAIDEFETSTWAYYSYTRKIVEDYYGSYDKAFDHITFSNMVKCNNETMTDTTPNDAKICCINKNKFIWKEVNIINPKRIIFYTHYYYDHFIEDFRPENAASFKDITDKEYWINVGNRTSLFWHRDFYDSSNKLICSFLRTSHPMMKRKKDFTSSIVGWLRQTE